MGSVYDDDSDEDLGPEPTLIGERLLREATGETDLLKAISLALHDKNIFQIQSLEACPNLRTADFSFNKIAQLNGLNCLAKLRELKLYDNRITQIGTHLTPLSALHTLDLSGNRLQSVQGLANLRSLKVLRLAYNQLSNLEGLGRATGLEVLDLSGNQLKDLTGLSSCIALKELTVKGNQLPNLKGIQRCQGLEELHASDNMLTTLQGLKQCGGTLDILNVSSNQLSSLDSLADGCTALSELYVADNKVSKLPLLAAKTPNLELLDAASNQLSQLQAVAAALSGLTSLSSIRLEANPLPPGYPTDLLAAVSQLESVDEEERPKAVEVWVNEEAQQGKGEEGGDPSRYEPTIAEMEEFKRRMGITSALPVMGRPGTPSGRPASGSSASSAYALLRSSGSGMAAVMRPGSANGLRPGSAAGRPGSAMGRPGTSSSAGAGPGSMKDIMMHQRPLSARTAGAAKLMQPAQYSQAVANFKDTMDSYSQQLRSVLTRMKTDLKLNVSQAAAQIKTPEGIAARTLPVVPQVPELPRGPARAAAAAPAPAAATAPAAAASSLELGGTPGRPRSGAHGPDVAAGKAPPVLSGLTRPSELDDPERDAALDLYKRLFPEGDSSRPGSSGTPTGATGRGG
eukprot:CAMPEP_0202918426 /NCGR_PEP_ID=MMETSP1392-20130828/73410_1 /ASSEMBLY_ACC=CAM_ASM_000868 /TAXON_ID=225041 /ORGANISM="Chlamydomonas chlamydogama, Strain SAG 11-48b" /LENGTH=627 /DNA_ID=CAMNT_0049611479 /DNA_START=133 /DNA_END=2013 /DNA_ORIENTATION=+